MRIIDVCHERIQKKILDGAMQPFFAFVPRAVIENWCRAAGHSWRVRVLCPTVTLVACLRKQLLPGTSARGIEDWLASFSNELSQPRDGHDFCAARARLPEPVFEQACEHLAVVASNASAMIWRQLQICIVDGTSCRTPRTLDNSNTFGHGSSHSGKSVLPVVRLVFLICFGSGAILRQKIGAYLESELRMFYSILPTISADTLIIGDGAFNSFLTLWQVQLRQCHALCTMDPTRRPEFVQRLGHQDQLQRWRRPLRFTTAFPELVPNAPETMLVRVIQRSVQRKGYRTWTLSICTTLLDASKYPADELAELYLQRWCVEDDMRAFKETLDLRRLTAKRAVIVRKEILSGILAYNLIRAIASQTKTIGRKLSFERTRSLLSEYCARMTTAATVQLPTLFKQLIDLVSATGLIEQTRPPEPRAIIQHPTCYPVLKMSRKAWRKSLNAVS